MGRKASGTFSPGFQVVIYWQDTLFSSLLVLTTASRNENRAQLIISTISDDQCLSHKNLLLKQVVVSAMNGLNFSFHSLRYPARAKSKINYE